MAQSKASEVYAETRHRLAAPLHDAVSTATGVMTSSKTQRLVVRSFVLAFVTISAIILAIGGYVSFRWVYIPKPGLAKDVWLQYGEARPPYAFIDLTDHEDVIASDQSYDVALDLIVPASDKNIDLGNFMVKLTLLTPLPTNATLISTSRPASLSFSQTRRKGLSSFSLARTLSLGTISSHDVQHISIPLLSSQVVQRSGRGKRIGSAAIEVGRKDAYATGPPKDWGELQIYEAKLRFDAQFTGIRWLMYHHPLTSFVLFTTAFLMCELIAALSVWGLIAYRRGSFSSSAYDEYFTDRSSSRPRRLSAARQPVSAYSTGASTAATSASRRKLSEVDKEASRDAQTRMAEAELVLGPRRRGMIDSDDDNEGSIEDEAPGLTMPQLSGSRVKKEEESEEEEKSWESLEKSGSRQSNIKKEDDEAGTIISETTGVTGTGTMTSS